MWIAIGRHSCMYLGQYSDGQVGWMFDVQDYDYGAIGDRKKVLVFASKGEAEDFLSNIGEHDHIVREPTPDEVVQLMRGAQTCG